MKPTSQFGTFDEAEAVRQAQRLRAETLAGWMRGLRRRLGGSR